MIKSIIVEDEPQSAERLKGLLSRYFSSVVEVVAVIDKVEDFMAICKEKNPALVFFDIQIGDTDAFNFLGQLDSVDFEVIFTTGHSEFAAAAFRVNAVDYLLKPIDRVELGEALEKFKARKSIIEMANLGDQLLDKLNLFSGAKRITVATLQGMQLVSVNEIVRCEADANYTHLFLRDKSKLTVSKTLREFEITLGKLGFLRVHNSHLVNLREIKSYQKGKGGVLTMNDHSEVEVSVRKKEDLMLALKSL